MAALVSPLPQLLLCHQDVRVRVRVRVRVKVRDRVRVEGSGF